MTAEEILDFIDEYFSGKHNGQRLGQAFLNKYCLACPNHDCGEHACLFNEPSNGAAIRLIYNTYLDNH